MRAPVYVAVLAALAIAPAAYAQTTGSEVQRNTNQQERIEQGLQSGQLNTKEAGKLERGESKVERMQTNAMKDGTLSSAEKARIRKAQNAESSAIYKQNHDAQTGNPASASSRRMQADVQRDVNQQARIKQGVASGSVTTAEAGKLEHGQARVNRREANAGADGHVGPYEQGRVQAGENVQSAHVYRKKHNAKVQ
ncbi:MAG TPA: hypothetical protein VMV45_02580 [Casimicrobiaceae bacterium]|nr:hypothetical protein [Casimicrobiaceae bacterium]